MGVLDGKVAIVTGAARGQGLAEATRFVAEGASVVLTDVLVDEGREAAAGLGPAARFVSHDITSADAWAEVITSTSAAFGGIDILVNNAGIHLQRAFEDTDEAAFRRVLDTNLVGAFLGIKAVVAPMRERGGGAIVNIASIVGTVGSAKTGPYSAAKHAVIGMTKTAALEVADQNIRINAVAPGYVETPFIMNRAPEVIEGYRQRHPMGRLAHVGDIAEVVAFLLSDRAGFTTGSVYLADGGFTAQ